MALAKLCVHAGDVLCFHRFDIGIGDAFATDQVVVPPTLALPLTA